MRQWNERVRNLEHLTVKQNIEIFKIINLLPKYYVKRMKIKTLKDVKGTPKIRNCQGLGGLQKVLAKTDEIHLIENFKF